MPYSDAFVEVKVSNLDKVKKEARRGAAKAVAMLAFTLEALVKEEITTRGLVDTGAMRASVYTETVGKDGRDVAMAEADALSLKGRHEPAPKAVTAFKPEDELEAKVAVGVGYGYPVEYRAKKGPYFSPAVDRLRPQAGKIAADIVKQETGG